MSESFARGSLVDEEIDHYTFEVESDTQQLVAEISWGADWGNYPAHDIDLVLMDPEGNLVLDAATLNIPERLIIDAPAKGDWDAFVIGYMLHGFRDRYSLSITDQSGKSLDD